MRRFLCLGVIAVLSAFLALDWFERALTRSLHVGHYLYELGPRPASGAAVATGLDRALAHSGLAPGNWVPVAGWPVMAATQVAQMPVGAYVTLSNRSTAFGLYVIITQSGDVLEYDIRRGK